MHDATRELLREAAPEPSTTPDFQRFWQRARRRRRLGQAATAAAGLSVVIVAAVVAGNVLPGNGGVSVGWRPTADTTLPVGPAGSASPEWVDGVPVWVKVDEAGAATVFDAVNPHPFNGLDELVGWCESSGWFQAWWDGSRFDGDGRYAFGPAPHDLVSYRTEVVDGQRVRLGERVIPEGRSHTDDEPDGAHCHGDGSGGLTTAEFHPIDGSGRDVFEGALVPGQDGVVRFCASPAGVPPSCPDGSPSVPQASAVGDRGLRGLFLANEQDGVLEEVIYLPQGYQATQDEDTADSLEPSESAVGKVAPPAPGMNLAVEVEGERFRGNEWSLAVPSGGQLALDIVGHISQEGAGGRLKLRLDDTRDGYRTVTTYLLTADAKAGERRFRVKWPMEDSGGRSIEPGRFHLFADLDTATSGESAGLGYVVITD